MNCALCGEPMNGHDSWSKAEPMHRECVLRESMGGIGHLLDHEHFCSYIGDPDARLPRRLSSLLVDAFVAYFGVEEAVERSFREMGSDGD